MRKIITTTFVTLDGVMQAPGGPEEDKSEGFKFGGWQTTWDEKDKIADDLMKNMMEFHGDLLLGRKTYDIWKNFWPKHKDDPTWGLKFNKAKKYVVSRRIFELSWENSELITGNVVDEIKKLKNSEGQDLWVWGSGNLIQTLLKNNLIDKMHIWTYPITIGSGKKLFAEGTLPENFKATDGKITSTGIIFSTYKPDGLLESY